MNPGMHDRRKIICQAWTQEPICAGANQPLIIVNVTAAASTPFSAAFASTTPLASP